jgi:hypothetical protein
LVEVPDDYVVERLDPRRQQRAAELSSAVLLIWLL